MSEFRLPADVIASRPLRSAQLAARVDELEAEVARLRAATAEAGGWRPISEYQHDGEDGGWGEEALLLVPGEYGPARLIGWLEAGMWLTRTPSEPVRCEDIATPTHFQPLPPTPTADPSMGADVGSAAKTG